MRKQFERDEDARLHWELEVRDLSLEEFWWKYSAYRGRIKRCPTSACIMITPAYSADCANVDHASHEGYARAAVVAYWRHMATERRHAMIADVMATGVKAVDVAFGGRHEVRGSSPSRGCTGARPLPGHSRPIRKVRGTRRRTRS